MKLFTLGPVEMYPETLQIEGTQPPYFRTDEFGAGMKDCERWFLQSVHAPANTLFVALTCSGSGAMDAAVMNLLREEDKVLIINGGTFGARFAEICHRLHISADCYEIAFQEAFSPERLEAYSGKGYAALLVNACETSTGQIYDLDYLGDFCRRNQMLLVVDAVSAYLADPIDMEQQRIDVLLTASQKALALSPGVSLVALSEQAGERVSKSCAPLYFNFNTYIENQKRGQPPFTCPVGTMLALHDRLRRITEAGIKDTIALHANRASWFREHLSSLPVRIPEFPLSNCCTPVLFPRENAQAVYRSLKQDHGLVVTPSGGAWAAKQLRVGHLGNLAEQDYQMLLEAMEELLL